MIARCNNTGCQQKIETGELPHGKFNGNSAARITEFATCPHCGMTDCHWIYAEDVLPKFDITVPENITAEYRPRFIESRIKKLTREWLEAN